MSSQPTDSLRSTEQALDAVYMRAAELRRRRSVRRVMSAAAGAVVVVALLIGTAALTGVDGHRDLATGGTLGETPETASDGSPETGTREIWPLLPEDQRQAWIASWNRMRDCMGSKGFEIPPAPPSFGDGLTPPPVVPAGGVEPHVEAAIAQCPLDLIGVDKEALAAAVEAASDAAMRETPPSTLDAETCASMRAAPRHISEEFVAQAEMAMHANDPELYDQFPSSVERREHIRLELEAGFQQSLTNSGC
jgi:hypothetical protein